MKRTCAALLLATLAASPASAAPPASPWHTVVITELMVSPLGIDAGVGQWIELQNPGNVTVNLQGMLLITKSCDAGNPEGCIHKISPAGPLDLEPGGVLVLGRTADTDLNGGVHVDYAYGGGLMMGPDADVVLLKRGDNQNIDMVVYDPSSEVDSVVPGATIPLEPMAPDQTMGSWCHGRTPFDDLGNKGTPGKQNTWCDDDHDGFAEDQGDCNDHDASVHPGAEELCNGVDDDCDGTTDEGPIAPPGCLQEGVCAGSVATCRGSAGFVCGYPATFQPVETACDGLDNDCNGLTDDGLKPPAEPCLAVGVCQGSHWECRGEEGFRCTYPDTFEHEERACDGLDNDCDGETDEGFQAGEACTSGLGACARQGTRACAADGLSAFCDAVPGSPSRELCGDGIDNDCDGQTDDGFLVGSVCTAGTGACAAVGKLRCSDDRSGVVCSAVPGPPASELCGDGIDNDCNGLTDEEGCTEPAGRKSSGCGTGATSGPVASLLVLLAVVVFRVRSASSRIGRGRWMPGA